MLEKEERSYVQKLLRIAERGLPPSLSIASLPDVDSTTAFVPINPSGLMARSWRGLLSCTTALGQRAGTLQRCSGNKTAAIGGRNFAAADEYPAGICELTWYYFWHDMVHTLQLPTVSDTYIRPQPEGTHKRRETLLPVKQVQAARRKGLTRAAGVLRPEATRTPAAPSRWPSFSSRPRKRRRSNGPGMTRSSALWAEKPKRA